MHQLALQKIMFTLILIVFSFGSLFMIKFWYIILQHYSSLQVKYCIFRELITQNQCLCTNINYHYYYMDYILECISYFIFIQNKIFTFRMLNKRTIIRFAKRKHTSHPGTNREKNAGSQYGVAYNIESRYLRV